MEPISLRCLAGLAMVAVTAGASPAEAQPAGDFQRAYLDAGYTQPLEANAGASIFWSRNFSSEGGAGPVVGGSVGQGGLQASGGLAVLGDTGLMDIRAVVTRTWDDPRGASANSTYVGGEVGWGLGVRLSVGYAKRAAGPSTDGDHILTWGVGLQLPVWSREPPRQQAVVRR
jgi:hypothetical protein